MGVQFFDDLNYKLSKNFSLKEFAVSRQFTELAEKIKFTLSDVLMLKVLAVEILQPIRLKFGPIEILSGKRSFELNQAVGGAPNSDHLSCNAVDINVVNFENLHIYKWLVMNSNLPYRQAIFYPVQNFIHISNNHPNKEVKHEAFVKVKQDYTPYIEYFKEEH